MACCAISRISPSKQAEIDHLHGSLTGVLGQLANFEGVAENDKICTFFISRKNKHL
jgi:hypothetical protein